jgi:hypothetical protein
MENTAPGDTSLAYEALRKHAAKEFLVTAEDGILGDQARFDIYYRGSMWYLAQAVEMGLDRREAPVERTAEFILGRCQKESGGFTLSWKPEVEVACRTGDMIRYLIRAGYDDERIDRGIRWIASHQRHDGGWLHCPLAGMCDVLKLALFNWSGSGLKREEDRRVPSCFYATIACAMALVDYRQVPGRNEEVIGRVAEFFLRRRMFRSEKDPGRTVRYKRNWNRDFTLLGYPILSQYDILFGLIFIARAGYFQDSRTGEAFNIIISRQNEDGTWNLDNAQTGMLYGNMGKGKPLGQKNKWVTLNALRLFKYAGIPAQP